MKNHDLPFIIPTLERCTHAIAVWIDQTLHGLQLTQGEAHILAYLAHNSPCSINDLHHSFGHKRSTLTSLLDRLERRGWITRNNHPTSRRLVQIELTPHGRHVGEQVNSALHELEERVMARIGDADAATFVRVTQIVQEEMLHERRDT